jgi:nucleotide-binding universal stress UspA family protein
MRIRDIKLILVPTDFSPASDRALEMAIELAQLTGASLQVLHVNPEAIWAFPPPGDVVTAPIDLGDTLAASAMQLEAHVSRVRAAGISCTGVSQTGKTDAEIVDHARTCSAGLIVVGSHGRQGLAHVLVGSVTEKVVRHAPCPILVVPPLVEETLRVRSDDEETSDLLPANLQPA